MIEFLVVAAVAVSVYLVQQIRLLPNAKIEAQSFAKSYRKFKSLSHLAKLMYAVKFTSTLLLVGVIGGLFAALIAGTIGAASSLIPGAPEAPIIMIFNEKIGILNLGMAVVVGFLGPDRSLGKLSERVLLGEQGSKQLWLKEQEEKLGSPLDIAPESGDNEDNNSRTQ